MRTALSMLLAVLLGAGGGVTTAVLTEGADPVARVAHAPVTQPSKKPTTEPTGKPGSPTATPTNDPLDLFVNEQDLTCSPGYIRIIGIGDSAPVLASAIADNKGQDPHYLTVADSCASSWVDPGNDVPTYVAYTGPYADPAIPCAARMTMRGDTVAHLKADNTNLVKCVCILGQTAAPTLTVDDPSFTEDKSIWTKQLQAMLKDLGRLSPADETGVYDATTAQAVTDLQSAGHLTDAVPGTMDAQTWQLLIGRTCGQGIYDW